MKTYVVVLRGINVSGRRIVKMDLLRKFLSDIGVENIKTYIQSGNIIFNSSQTNIKELENDISGCIKNNFGFEVPVIVRTHEEWLKVIDKNPFLDEVGIEPDKLHVVFLGSKPSNVEIDELKKYNFQPDEFVASGREIYLYCPNGYARTKLSNNFFEKIFKQHTTTRNWKTVNKINEIIIN